MSRDGDLGELPGQLAELRELIREAHGATKDIRAAIKEARTLVDTFADACAAAAYHASNAEMGRWAEHVQREMNDRARDLNRAVIAARDHIGRALMPKIAAVELTDDDEPPRLIVQFAGNLFDADVPTSAVPESDAIAEARALREHMRRWAAGTDTHKGETT